MPVRERAFLGDAMVTILERSGSKRHGKATIRDQFGFKREVSVRDLTFPDKEEPGSQLKFEEPGD